MSWDVEKWLADHCDIEHLGMRFLLFSMANQASDGDGKLFSKNASFMKRMNVSERTVQRWTRELEQRGWIKKLPDHASDGRQLCNVYQIVMPPASERKSPPKADKLGRVTALSPSHRQSSLPRLNVTLPVTPESHPPGDSHSVTPIRNQTDNPNGEQRTPPTPSREGAAPPISGKSTHGVFQGLSTRLWDQQRILITRKLGRQIKRQLAAGVPVEAIWRKYFALPELWEPPRCSYAGAWLIEVTNRVRADVRVTNGSWTTWFAVLIPVRFDPVSRLLTVAFPERAGQLWFEANYGEVLRDNAAASAITVEFWQPSSAGRNT